MTRFPHLRNKTTYISDWKMWVDFCQRHDLDPYEECEHGRDLGGGDSYDIEYIGDYPEREDEE